MNSTCFNPCFNGTMYKNSKSMVRQLAKLFVSILVLMELCIKTDMRYMFANCYGGFNPCFNGTMYKNRYEIYVCELLWKVSILVLMELCIKTPPLALLQQAQELFQSLF